VSISTDPPGGEASITIPAVKSSGARWGAFNWGAGTWARKSPTGSSSGVPAGTFGRRIKLTISSTPDADYVPTGIDLGATLLPDKEY
jgi:hypothetical protein